MPRAKKGEFSQTQAVTRAIEILERLPRHLRSDDYEPMMKGLQSLHISQLRGLARSYEFHEKHTSEDTSSPKHIQSLILKALKAANNPLTIEEIQQNILDNTGEFVPYNRMLGNIATLVRTQTIQKAPEEKMGGSRLFGKYYV